MEATRGLTVKVVDPKSAWFDWTGAIADVGTDQVWVQFGGIVGGTELRSGAYIVSREAVGRSGAAM